jgi:Na+/proline symporter
MEYTEQQKVEFKEQFRERKKRQIVVAVLMGILLIPVLIIRAFPNSVNSEYAFFIGIAFLPAVVFAIIFSHKNWRCPACGKYLGQSINLKHCQSCGIAFQ